MSLSIVQIIMGLLTVASALMVVTQRNPVVSAVMLMVTLFLTGGIFFGLGFMFIGAVQILIYAGAISVLFVFIVMLLDLKPSVLSIPGSRSKFLFSLVASVLVATALVGSALMSPSAEAPLQGDLSYSSAESISLTFVSKHMLSFQVTGLLLLAVVMGATLLGRKKRAS
jgi:NADH-quinone oxidoreductase subunit J